jgi:hypothetical protein
LPTATPFRHAAGAMPCHADACHAFAVCCRHAAMLISCRFAMSPAVHFTFAVACVDKRMLIIFFRHLLSSIISFIFTPPMISFSKISISSSHYFRSDISFRYHCIIFEAATLAFIDIITLFIDAIITPIAFAS